MPMTLQELADKLNASLRGDGYITVSGCAALQDATSDDVSFLTNRKYAQAATTTNAAAIIVSPKDAETLDGRNLLITDQPQLAYRNAMVELHGWRPQPEPGISTKAYIDDTAEIGDLCTIRPFVYIAPGAKIGKRCVIYPNTYIGKNSVVGDDTILHPNVVVYDRCVIGKRVTLHAGCIIGQDGFGYATHNGKHLKIPAPGNVIIEDDVEMGAGCVVDRATVGSTVIGEGTKFSDLVAIGHGTRVGKHNLFVAQVGLAGTVTTGDYVVIGGQAGVADHLKIGDGARIAAKSGVMHDLPGNEEYGGQPAMPLTEAKRYLLASTRVPDLLKEIKKIKQQLENHESRLPSEDL